MYTPMSDVHEQIDGWSMLPEETNLLMELITQDKSLVLQFRNYLQPEGIDIIQAVYPNTAIEIARKYNPDCIIIDADSDLSHKKLSDKVFESVKACACPVIIITDNEELYHRNSAYIAARLKRNFRKSTLLSSIHYALNSGVSEEQQYGKKILCVDEDEETAVFISRCLENEGYTVDCPTESRH